jgi:hypothetical protein
VAIKWILCPVTSGTILVDRLAETSLGVGDTLRDVIESMIESMGGTVGNGVSSNGRAGLVIR